MLHASKHGYEKSILPSRVHKHCTLFWCFIRTDINLTHGIAAEQYQVHNVRSQHKKIMYVICIHEAKGAILASMHVPRIFNQAMNIINYRLVIKTVDNTHQNSLKYIVMKESLVKSLEFIYIHCTINHYSAN